MAIPDHQGWMFPLLQAVSDRRDHALRDLTEQLADQPGLTMAATPATNPSDDEI